MTLSYASYDDRHQAKANLFLAEVPYSIDDHHAQHSEMYKHSILNLLHMLHLGMKCDW
jgi:hypothetical protein